MERCSSWIWIGMLFAGLSSHAAAQSADFEDPGLADAGEMTSAGQAVEDRALARALIEYGRRSRNPEAIATGVTILARHPIRAAKGGNAATQRLEKELDAELRSVLDEARSMRPADRVLAELIARASEAIEERTRGLAEGPQRWTVSIDRGEFYELDPRLVYQAQQKAIVHAYSGNKATLGIRVRRGDQRKYLAQSTGQGKVSAAWNAGIYTTGWIVRVYNLSGPDKLEVVVETN